MIDTGNTMRRKPEVISRSRNWIAPNVGNRPHTKGSVKEVDDDKKIPRRKKVDVYRLNTKKRRCLYTLSSRYSHVTFYKPRIQAFP